MALPDRRCPQCGFDPAPVSPSDAAVAARSYPRRFRGLLVRPDDEDPEIVHRRPPSGGPSAAGHAIAAAAGMNAAAAALHRVRVADEPGVDPDAPPPAEGGRVPSLEAVLEGVGVAAGALAGVVEAMHGDEWRRAGRLADGGRVVALELARAGVHAGIHHLRAAERALAEVR